MQTTLWLPWVVTSDKTHDTYWHRKSICCMWKVSGMCQKRLFLTDLWYEIDLQVATSHHHYQLHGITLSPLSCSLHHLTSCLLILLDVKSLTHSLKQFSVTLLYVDKNSLNYVGSINISVRHFLIVMHETICTSVHVFKPARQVNSLVYTQTLKAGSQHDVRPCITLRQHALTLATT